MDDFITSEYSIFIYIIIILMLIILGTNAYNFQEKWFFIAISGILLKELRKNIIQYINEKKKLN